mmetsp:Transcript_14495/g.30502  ORF Transcript_14495/g.30502 Transcript_14495/m.30502 type:complete len:263 (+) Transcript_14495:85-873(+)|eukprot:CAMPEP_0171350558 /NCGR_PEP_ID=MMETSP0878-20121228/36692_1 /TAXON_ID=67004 /ORGANISM="Thalassiosira weissflogii, Strain CCMP1336" /LENGTH=262 /DNA_ID=CAMNT_0011855513 /DNA_START=58 /DNA_END=846 /DNA_ORIENTATION=+
MTISITKLIGATLTVTLTTVDDSVWLVAYTSPKLPLSTRIIHAALFVLTLEVLVFACVVIASFVQLAVVDDQESGEESMSRDGPNDEILLGSIGACLCWIISGVLFVRKWLKRKRHISSQAGLLRASTQQLDNKYGSIDEPDGESGKLDDASSSSSDSNADQNDISNQPSPWVVASLTALGALDEVSYFPSLILGNVFTSADLCLGTFFAACIVLVVVTVFLSRCKPILDFLDSIPLYGIVATFAFILTIEVVADVLSSHNN